MSGKKSKSKGFRFERKCCDLWSGFMPHLSFSRTPGSGGWNKEIVTGDIFPILVATGTVADDFPYSVECKSQENWSMEEVLRGAGKVFLWWEQCLNDAVTKCKIPFLMFTRNFIQVFVMFPSHVVGSEESKARLSTTPRIVYGDVTIMTWKVFTYVKGGQK